MRGADSADGAIDHMRRYLARVGLSHVRVVKSALPSRSLGPARITLDDCAITANHMADYRPQMGARQPASRASRSLQNQRSPLSLETLVFAYQGDHGGW